MWEQMIIYTRAWDINLKTSERYSCFLFILCFVAVINAGVIPLTIYTCHRHSKVYLDDYPVGLRNVRTYAEPGPHKITVIYKDHIVTDSIIVPVSHNYSHTQVAAGVTIGVDLSLFGIYNPLSTNYGIAFSPVLTIHNNNLL